MFKRQILLVAGMLFAAFGHAQAQSNGSANGTVVEQAPGNAMSETSAVEPQKAAV